MLERGNQPLLLNLSFQQGLSNTTEGSLCDLVAQNNFLDTETVKLFLFNLLTSFLLLPRVAIPGQLRLHVEVSKGRRRSWRPSRPKLV